jgi:hypothetical protein
VRNPEVSTFSIGEGAQMGLTGNGFVRRRLCEFSRASRSGEGSAGAAAWLRRPPSPSGGCGGRSRSFVHYSS